MKKSEDFPGWEDWKTANKAGLECELSVEKKGNRLSLKIDTLGIHMENVTTFAEEPETVYLALTGDQVALTDIRVRQF